MSDSQPPPVLDVLSPLEEAVIDAARRGTWVQPDTRLEAAQLVATEDPGMRVRAELIRELLMGRRGELDPRGVLIRGVRVVDLLDLDHVTAVTGLAMVGCAVPDGFKCKQAQFHQVDMRDSMFTTLDAEGVRIDGSLFLDGAHISGVGQDVAERGQPGVVDQHGALRLVGARIGGQLSLDRATVTNTTGPALHAENLHTDGHLFLRSAHISGVGQAGALRLVGAHIGGQLGLDRATVTNTTGPALHADSVRIDGSLFLRGAHISGAGEDGALRLLGAHIGGQLGLDRATVTNTTGVALDAENLHTDGHLFLRGAHISGAGEDGALRLLSAHIGGQAILKGTQLANKSGPLLGLTGAQVIGAFFLPAAVVCPQSRLDPGGGDCPDSTRRMVVSGLVYTQLRDISWRQWLHLLVHHTPEYRPQPYQQLASVERAAGHDNNARLILVTQQDDLRRRAPDAFGGPIARWRHWLWGWLGRYGYRAHRLVAALLVVLALAGTTGYTAGQITTRPDHRAAERVQTPTAPATPCSTAELIGLGIDRGLPVGATGLRARCDLDTATRWGQAFTYLLWALQALLWALATLTIAAYTGLIRKTT